MYLCVEADAGAPEEKENGIGDNREGGTEQREYQKRWSDFSKREGGREACLEFACRNTWGLIGDFVGERTRGRDR